MAKVVRSAFDDADFYDASGEPAELHHRTVEEALRDAVDCWCEPGCGLRASAEAHAPFVVAAYATLPIEPSWRDAVACDLTERYVEVWEDDWGGGDEPTSLPEREAIRNAIRAALDLDTRPAWQCRKVGEMIFSATEVIALLEADLPGELDP